MNSSSVELLDDVTRRWPIIHFDGHGTFIHPTLVLILTTQNELFIIALIEHNHQLHMDLIEQRYCQFRFPTQSPATDESHGRDSGHDQEQTLVLVTKARGVKLHLSLMQISTLHNNSGGSSSNCLFHNQSWTRNKRKERRNDRVSVDEQNIDDSFLDINVKRFSSPLVDSKAFVHPLLSHSVSR